MLTPKPLRTGLLTRASAVASGAMLISMLLTVASSSPAQALTPTGRDAQAMAYYDAAHHVYMFGGAVATDGHAEDDFWYYNQADDQWYEITPGESDPWPCKRIASRMVYINANIGANTYQELLLVAGQAGDNCDVAEGEELGDAWLYTTAGGWDQVCDPCTDINSNTLNPRQGVAMAYDRSAKKAFLFGGYDNPTFYSDTWSFNPGDNSWLRLCGSCLPPARQSATMAWDGGRSHVILYGGASSGATSLDDGWVLSSPSSPFWSSICSEETGCTGRDRVGARADWDPVRSTVDMFGGATYGMPNVFLDQLVWEKSTLGWICKLGTPSGECSASPTPRPHPRISAGAAFDIQAGVFVIMGGAFNAGGGKIFCQDTWEYNPSVGANGSWGTTGPTNGAACAEP
jgi:Galactose oxidase, central domain